MSRTAPTIFEADLLGFARTVLRTEATALERVAEQLDDGFVQVACCLAGCTGRVAVTGIGKSADVGRKTVGTFNSTGTRAYFLDATNALHGDLGAIHPDDVALEICVSTIRLLPEPFLPRFPGCSTITVSNVLCAITQGA